MSYEFSSTLWHQDIMNQKVHASRQIQSTAQRQRKSKWSTPSKTEEEPDLPAQGQRDGHRVVLHIPAPSVGEQWWVLLLSWLPADERAALWRPPSAYRIRAMPSLAYTTKCPITAFWKLFSIENDHNHDLKFIYWCDNHYPYKDKLILPLLAKTCLHVDARISCNSECSAG
jgi:hypothetical protein